METRNPPTDPRDDLGVVTPQTPMIDRLCL